jgi:hypothetical protein
MKGNYMTSNRSNSSARKRFLGVLVIAVFCVLCGSFNAQAQSESKSAQSSPPAQKMFASPDQAVEALIQAADPYDEPALLQIFGPDGASFISSSDPIEDKERAAAFVAEAREKKTVETDPKNPNRAILVVGSEEWPFPVPMVKINGKWHFDSKAGRKEILDRRIGTNELDVISILRGYVEAQLEYASQIHDDSGVNQYAQRILSTPGKHDGLAWQDPDGSWAGPVGEQAAKALAQGYQEKRPFHGYYFRLLQGQGPAARLGTLDYMVEGVMIGGFALVAWPAEYRVTGVQTFIVSYDGVVYQQDLGPNTATIAAAMQRYNPDKTWRATDDDW